MLCGGRASSSSSYSAIAEPDRERLYGPRGQPGHQREDGGRIHATAQERAQRHVRAKPDPDGLGELGADPLDRLGLRHGIGHRRVRPAPERGDRRVRRRLPSDVQRERCAGRQTPHSLEDSLLAGNVSEREETQQRLGIRRRHPIERRENALRLGREQQSSPVL